MFSRAERPEYQFSVENRVATNLENSEKYQNFGQPQGEIVINKIFFEIWFPGCKNALKYVCDRCSASDSAQKLTVLP